MVRNIYIDDYLRYLYINIYPKGSNTIYGQDIVYLKKLGYRVIAIEVDYKGLAYILAKKEQKKEVKK